MLTATALRALYDHHAWSMGRLLARAAEVAPEQAEATPWEGVASLQDTLAHIVRAERYWLANWREAERQPFAPPRDVPEARDRWMALQAETRAFLASVTEADLRRILTLRQPIGGGRETLAAGVTHVLLHAAQHRAEAAALLSQFGRSPGELDYIDFLEHREALIATG